MKETTNLEGKLREYIKCIQKAKKDAEERNDASLGSCADFNATAGSEFITLAAVIRDLEKIAYPKDFTYWDAK